MAKLEALADDKSDVAKMTITVFDRVENAVGKGENAGDQHFLLFPLFSIAFFLRVVKSQDWMVKGYKSFAEKGENASYQYYLLFLHCWLNLIL